MFELIDEAEYSVEICNINRVIMFKQNFIGNQNFIYNFKELVNGIYFATLLKDGKRNNHKSFTKIN
jgi:hypothetical protein